MQFKMIAMKKILLIIAAFCFVLAAKAQLLGSVNFDPKNLSQFEDSTLLGNNLFVDAIRPALFLSRQSFQVKDKKTGDLYGLNNKDEFGTEITLGIKVKNGYVLTDRAISPWKYNDKFETYKEKYDPVMFVSEYSECGDAAKYDTLSITRPNMLLSESLYLISSDCFSNKGLVIDGTKGKKDGWVILAGTDKDVDLNKTAKLQLSCYRKSVEANEGNSIDIDTPDNQNILGGIYVTPVNTDIGALEFRVCGIILENNGKWSVHFPFIGKEKLLKQTPDKAVQDTKVESKDNLTPVDDMYQQKSAKDKKAKKNKKSKQK